MLRGSIGHRRYSITHRAVQRLRELVQGMESFDDESLRDQLDRSLTQAEDEGRAVRTLDAMLREPQVLVPVTEFGDTLYAIIKEDTVVTVLPRNHGEEILQRGKALEERVSGNESNGASAPAAETTPPPPPRRVTPPRREREAPVEDAPLASAPSAPPSRSEGDAPAPGVIVLQRSSGRAMNGQRIEPEKNAGPMLRRRQLRSPGDKDAANRPAPPPRPRDNPIAGVLYDALRDAERAAKVRALTHILDEQDTSLEFLDAWDRLRSAGMPSSTTMDEFIDACKAARSPAS